MTHYLRLLKYLLPYKTTIFITWGLSILVVSLHGVSVWVGAGFIEKLLTGKMVGASNHDTNFLLAFMDRLAATTLQQATPFKSLIAGVVVLVGSAVLITVFRVIKSILFVRVNESILQQIRSEMFLHLTRLDLSFSRTFQPGKIASLFIKDVGQLRMAMFDMADRMFMQPLRLIMAIVLMLSLSVKLTLFAIVFFVVSSLMVHLVGDRVENLTKKMMKKIADLQGVLTEYLSSVILVRSMGREKKDLNIFSKSCESLAKSTVEFDVTQMAIPQMISNLFVISGGIVLVIGGYSVLVDHTMAGSDLVKFVLLIPVATYPIEALASLYISIRVTLASAKRVFSFLDEEVSFSDHPDAVDPPDLRDGIELKKINYNINGATILDNISISIPHGSTTVLYGPSGSGKTTILSLIAGFVRPDGGSVEIDNLDLSRIKGEKWRDRIGIVNQEPILINGTVRENLLYATPDVDDQTLEQVLREVLLWNEHCVFPEGLDTQVGNRGELISGGERQRLTIARCLLKDPDLILLDEPTAMLDMGNKIQIKKTLISLSRKRTIVIATHDDFLMDIADRKVKIEEGKIA